APPLPPPPTPASSAYTLSPCSNRPSTPRRRNVRLGSRNVQCQATLRCSRGIPAPRYSSKTSSRSSSGPRTRRNTSATAAAVTSAGSTSATSRSTGGCVGSAWYDFGLSTATSSRTSNPSSGAAHPGASASSRPADPTTPPPPRFTATQPTAPPVAGCTSQEGAATSTANSKWRFKSHMSISGTFAPSDQCGGCRATV